MRREADHRHRADGEGVDRTEEFLGGHRGGDIPEHMEEGRTGIFFDSQEPEAIITAVKKFAEVRFNPEYIRSKALKFDREIFKSKIKDYVEKQLILHKNSGK